MYRKNTAGQFVHFQGIDSSTGGIKSGVTWTMRRCIDGTFAAGGGTVTEDGTTGWYKCALAQADTNGNNIGFNFTGTGAVPQTINIITDGSPPDINLKNAAGTAVTLDANNVLNVSAKYLAGTALTARDIGASVLLSAGTGTGQLDFTSGITKSNLTQILGTTLTETAGQIAAAFKKFFNIATPAATMDHLVLVDTVTTATTATNLTNAPTNGDLTATMKTSVQTAADAAITANTLLTTNLDAAISSRATPANILTTALTEAYAGLHAAPTLAQVLFEIRALLAEKAVSGTTLTVKKLDGSTTAETFTLDDSASPTSITRAT